jgi:hypothetical protein
MIGVVHHGARRLLPALALVVLAAGCDSPTLEPPAGIWVLQTVAGVPVPAAVDTLYAGDTARRFHERIVFRSIRFVGRDSLQYTYARDQVAVSSGGVDARSASCASNRTRYERNGNRFVFRRLPPAGAPQPAPGTPAVFDTVEITGDRLIQRVHRAPTRVRPFPRTLHLEYAPHPGADPGCGPDFQVSGAER